MPNALSPRPPLRLMFVTPVLAALLTAFGGSDDDATAAVPTGPMGLATARATGVMQAGTYSVSGDVTTGSTLALQRKPRVNTDGSLQWLNAANSDAVLFSLMPTSTGSERRVPYNFQTDNWGLAFVKYDAVSGGYSASVNSGAGAVRVLYNNLREDCAAPFAPALAMSPASNGKPA